MDRLDVKLWALAEKGQIVPDRSLLKTPEQIAEIRKSADLNTAVLDHVAAHIKAGMSTAQIDKLVYDFTTCLLYTSPSPRDGLLSRMPSSA